MQTSDRGHTMKEIKQEKDCEQVKMGRREQVETNENGKEGF